LEKAVNKTKETIAANKQMKLNDEEEGDVTTRKQENKGGNEKDNEDIQE
jgi:hypothetical protein